MLTVSLCVVAFNEEKYLPSLLKDIGSQTYPHEYTEVVLVDSMSTDGTRKIMEDFKLNNTTFKSVVIADNPKKFQAPGWNVAIKTSSGDVIIRLDAHAHIPEDFTCNNMVNIHNDEYVSGGIRPCLIENKDDWSRMLLDAENSLFGSSINESRRSERMKYVKTMFHAAYRREVFECCGGFNENLLRTEDNEMHYRIRKAGYRLCYDPNIVSYQYARNSLKKSIKQKYGNGYWIGLTLGVCPGCISFYHLIPLAFVLAIFVTTLLSVFGIWQLSALMWILYGIFAITNTVLSSVGKEFNPYNLLMPFVFLCLHVSYGMGSLIGIIKMPFKRNKLKLQKEN